MQKFIGKDFEINSWLNLITEKILDRFRNRLIFIGFVGSYARGEAGPNSDIDINVILDKVDTNDVSVYKEIVQTMPFKEKACGFLAGKDEIKAWPRNEIFHFLFDCKILYGSVSDIIEEPAKKEIVEYIRIAASGILHFTGILLFIQIILNRMSLISKVVLKMLFLKNYFVKKKPEKNKKKPPL